LRRRITLHLSDQERTLVVAVFPQFLDVIKDRGASFLDLQVLHGILRPLKESYEMDEVLEALSTCVTNLLETVVPDPMTLEEASDIYDLNSATLRRACGAGKLPAEKRGKTWLVKSSDLEQYLARTRRARRSR
jgi:excisionase family DNA binding protein